VAAGLANIAALSLEVDYPTLASIPHSVINGYKNVLAVALETDVLFPLAEKVRWCVVLVAVVERGSNRVTAV
jgi:large subunit ribosomal protein LP0